jgi:hypothetical protein
MGVAGRGAALLRRVGCGGKSEVVDGLWSSASKFAKVENVDKEKLVILEVPAQTWQHLRLLLVLRSAVLARLAEGRLLSLRPWVCGA